MSKLLTIWNYIRRHKYMITVLIFIVVIGFLDEKGKQPNGKTDS